MTVYLVDVHHHTHTCPADGEPHPFDSRQTIVAVTPATGACLTPITIRVGDTTAEIPCRRHEPSDRRCANCRTVTWIRTVTETFHGHHQPIGIHADIAADLPCPRCGMPMMGLLGTHLLCTPARSRQAA